VSYCGWNSRISEIQEEVEFLLVIVGTGKSSHHWFFEKKESSWVRSIGMVRRKDYFDLNTFGAQDPGRSLFEKGGLVSFHID
jgi:hypothetical protein